MTPYQRMCAGLPYHSEEDDLPARRAHAQALTQRFNVNVDRDERQAILRELLGECGERISIRGPFYCDYGSNIVCGEDFYANFHLVILDVAPVRFGARVFLAPNVAIYTASHPIDAEQRAQGWESGLPVSIGDDVWIGGNVTICPGVTIGSNVVIGAGSVVTRDLPDNVIAVGNPCRVLREITADDRTFYDGKHHWPENFDFSVNFSDESH